MLKNNGAPGPAYRLDNVVGTVCHPEAGAVDRIHFAPGTVRRTEASPVGGVRGVVDRIRHVVVRRARQAASQGGSEAVDDEAKDVRWELGPHRPNSTMAWIGWPHEHFEDLENPRGIASKSAQLGHVREMIVQEVAMHITNDNTVEGDPVVGGTNPRRILPQARAAVAGAPYEIRVGENNPRPASGQAGDVLIRGGGPQTAHRLNHAVGTVRRPEASAVDGVRHAPGTVHRTEGRRVIDGVRRVVVERARRPEASQAA